MRYKAITENFEGPGLTTYYTDDCIVTLIGKKLVDTDIYPYPYCLVSGKNVSPKGYHCYKTPDGIVFDNYEADFIDFCYWVPETHIMFNIDILYSLFEYIEPVSNIKARLKLAHKGASKYIKRSVKQAKKIKKLK